LHEKSIIAIVTVIVSDFLAFVFSDTQKNESQEYQSFVREFWRKIGVCVYTFLCVKKIVEKADELFSHCNCEPKELLFAIIDFSSLVCTPLNPKHEICPFKDECRLYIKNMMLGL